MERQRTLFEIEPPAWEVDAADERLVASVVFAERPYGPLDYLVPESLRAAVEPGRRVRVPLGRGDRPMIGYCVAVSPPTPGSRALKEIRGVVDDRPLLTPSMLALTHWMSEYYLCPHGQVLEGVVPAGVRVQAGTREQTFLSVPTAVAARLTQLDLPRAQAAALQALAASPHPLTSAQLAAAARCTMGPINELRKKELIRAEVKRVRTAEFKDTPTRIESHLDLSSSQQQALDTILAAVESRTARTLLLYGVTGSGKTEVYIRAIHHLLGFGRQAIVLVPEISLTPQTLQRFRTRFEHVTVLHSHLSPAERHARWEQIASGESQVVIGARSAVFAPVPRLGMIVLDEEHDASFKQDTAPRYHARDVALQRALFERIPLVLGSATPSLESWQRCQDGAYQLLSLPRRVEDRPLPDVATIDMRTEYHHSGAISRQLEIAMRRALDDGGQVILLLNRRGFSTHIQCPKCGTVVVCPDCDIALTHHREDDVALCHYCDYQVPTPRQCPQCDFTGVRFSGLGTQRLEAEIRKRFPSYRCLRMDSDSMRKPGSHERALASVRSGDVRILLGTQMIAKGLDFPDVTLVGVISADTALHMPDFRATERTFQLITQVAGRTGRGPKGGRVLVQTASPEHPAIIAATRHDFLEFAARELPVRRDFGYPPFGTLVRIVIRGPAAEATSAAAEALVARIRAEFEQLPSPARALGPAPAPIAKLRGEFRFHAILQSADGDALRAAVHRATSHTTPLDEIRWIVDVDPLDMR